MVTRQQFRSAVADILKEIGEETLNHDPEEFFMVQSPYEYLEFYAEEKQLLNTAVALPLTLGLHDGTHRRSTVLKGGVAHRLPYVIHPLQVAQMLAELQLPIPAEEEDILLAAALCHDMIEDLPFPENGMELVTRYHLSPRVYNTVKTVSKRKDFTPEEEEQYFTNIANTPLAMLIKLSDRGNNVEDLYNMSVWKVHEYIGETRRWFLPMCEQARVHYPRLQTAVDILQDKIVTLTAASEILVDRYDQREKALIAQAEELRAENEELRAQWKALRKT